MTAILTRFPATSFPSLQTPPVFYRQAVRLSSASSIPYPVLAKLCSQMWPLCPAVPCERGETVNSLRSHHCSSQRPTNVCIWWKGSSVHLHKERVYCLQLSHLVRSPCSPSGSGVTTPFCFKTLGGHLSPSPNDVLRKTSFLYLQKCDGNMNINNSHGFPANIHHHRFEASFWLAWHGGNCSAERECSIHEVSLGGALPGALNSGAPAGLS